MADGSVTIDTNLDTKGFEKGLGSMSGIASKFGSVLKTTFAVGTAAIAGTTTALVALGKAAVTSYAEYEQLQGGIVSMFGGMENGAKEIEKVTGYAENAWKDLTMSTSDYYKTFASTYPLMKNDIKDQNEAIKETNRLMTLESDLANTFGYSFETASNAINWALKGSFNYVDNLNLGIKGTQEGFLEAAKKAGYMVDNVKDLTSQDILNVLEYTASQYGVLGKTAEEAMTTIQGSMKALKASYDNFLNGSGKISAVIVTFKTVVKNVSSVVATLIPEIINGIANALPEILECGVGILNSLIEGINEAVPNMIPTMLSVVAKIVETLLKQTPTLIKCGINVILEIIKGINKELPALIKMLPNVVKEVQKVLIDHLPELTKVSLEMMLVLARGIIECMPEFLQYGPMLIEEMTKTLIDHMDELVPIAAQMIFTLATGLLKNFPMIITMTWRLVGAFIGAIIENFPTILQKGAEMIGNLISGIGSKLGEVWDKATEVGQKVKDAIKKFIEEAFTWGKDMIQGFINGMNSKKPAVSVATTGIAGAIKSLLHFSRPDKGPLRDYETWMPDMIKGLASTMKNATPLLERQAREMASKLQMAVNMQQAEFSIANNVLRGINVDVNVKGGDMYFDTERVGEILAPSVSNTIKAGGAY